MGRLEIDMGPKEAAESIKNAFPADVTDITEFQGQINITVKKDRIKEILRYMHDTPGMEFHFLSDICGVDYLGKKEPRYEVVYHIYSMKNRIALRIKAQVSEDDLAIDSVVDVWSGANWRERECFDMFGIRFNGHPDLRRLLMPDDWDGFPLRKDYPLQSDLGDREWKGYNDTVETAKKNSIYGVR
jgi:NADH-quinone oxidoreductase subunit C